ncbi:MAG: hypothetical protein RLO23_02140 [Alphaproteobacteria bacterium]
MGLTVAQRRWLECGLDGRDGKLPLFDRDGRAIHPQTIRRCVELGYAEPWFRDPLRTDFPVCKLTPRGRTLAEASRRRLRLATNA